MRSAIQEVIDREIRSSDHGATDYYFPPKIPFPLTVLAKITLGRSAGEERQKK